MQPGQRTPPTGECFSGGPSFINGIEVSNFSVFNTSGLTFDLSGNCTVPWAERVFAQRGRQFDCSTANGYVASGGLCVLSNKQNAEANLGSCTDSLPSVAHPINPATGNKYLVETDYRGTGPMPLEFTRTYNSKVAVNVALGKQWRHIYERRIVLSASGSVTTAKVYRADGKAYYFNLVNGLWQADSDIIDRLTWQTDANGFPLSYTYITNADDQETYNADGNLISITNRAGLTTTLAYDPSTQTLTSVTDPFGRQLMYTYDGSGRIINLTDPAGGSYKYAYGSNNNLVSVTYSDNKVRTYVYGEAANTSGANLPNALTGMIDEDGNRFATWTYDTSGRAISSGYAGGVDQYQIAYNADGHSSVTDPLGAVRTYRFQAPFTQFKNSAIEGPACSSCSASASATYDANGFTASRTDYNGNVTQYVHDSRGLETSRTEAFGTLQSRTITTSYHPTFHLPTQINEPGRMTILSYDAAGNLLTKSITDTVSSKVRTFTYTYNSNGQVLTLDGPRTDATDITTYTYYPNDDADHGRAGQLASVTNALGQATNITTYNAHGQPLTIVDPNGLTTQLSYDARLRLTSRDVGGETTTYTYDGVGQLILVTLPDGSSLTYTYDAAHRLTQIADNLGNKIVYTLDLMGNRTQEQVFDPNNNLAQTRSRVYSNLNRLAQDIGAQNQITQYAYDNQGNLTQITDPLNHITGNAYDALNRLIRVTDPNNGATQYGYDPLDHLTQVTDPRTLATSYGYDGLDNLNQQISPDTGTTQNTYDAAGNLLTQRDAKGQLTTYVYDALSRVTNIAYADGQTIAYSYDQGVNGVGRLTGITDSNGSISYAYDQKGRLLTETRVINNITYITAYAYDSAGRLSGMSYPSSRQVAYTRDGLGRISQIDTTSNGTTQNLVSQVNYRPFGGVQFFTFGNGQIYIRAFDLDGRIASYTLPNQSFALGYDAASRIGFISDIANPANTTNLGYDSLDRLTSFAAPSTTQSFAYDAVGNRTAQTIGGNTNTYSYGTASNRLASLTPTTGPVRNFSFDANGSTTNDAVNQYNYDARGRLTQTVSVAGTSNYQLNSLGQRIRKTNTQGDTLYHYDSQGRLIAESSASGTTQKEYVYLGDIPVAVFQ